jgi:very-short-patch-repair endonuclease
MILIYPTLQTQFKEEWCKKIKKLPYDFCIPEYKTIIELDGPQHFHQVSNWSSAEDQFENDKYKEECANENGYSVIRLLQEDVFYDTYDWVKELCDSIKEIKASDEITNIYLCKNDEYDKY